MSGFESQQITTKYGMEQNNLIFIHYYMYELEDNSAVQEIVRDIKLGKKEN